MRGFLGRLFGTKSRNVVIGEVRDPMLMLARDWVVARGGQITTSDTDTLRGTLPDGTMVGYTCAPQRLREEPDLSLLTPHVPEFDALCQDIAGRAISPVFRITQAPANAVPVVRAAFAPPQDGCHTCTTTAPSGHDGGDVSSLCEACPLRRGRLVLAGASAVREVVIMGEYERTTYDYLFAIGVTSSQGRRDELIQIAVDGTSGEQVEPLVEAILQRAQVVAPDDSTSDPRKHIASTEALVWPAAQAAARLARAQVLLDYQHKQDDLVAQCDHLLIETPEAGQQALMARERALGRLADTYAIELETRLAAVATICTPVVEAHVRMRDGASFQTTADVCRGTVMPLCAACSAAWSVGVRCAEGHITCTGCQQQCGHCGRRRCSLCEQAPFGVCTDCGTLTCAVCARATARGRHKVRSAGPASSRPSLSSTAPGLSAATSPGDRDLSESVATTNDLCIADLDVMTPATWRAFVMWLIAEMGLIVERDVGQVATDLAFVCRAGGIADDGGVAEHGSLLLVFGHRPSRAEATSVTHELDARMQAIARSFPGARMLLITTQAGVSASQVKTNDRDRAHACEIIDRAWLVHWLGDRPTMHRRAREEAMASTEAQAAAAAHLRTVVTLALNSVVAQLSHPGMDMSAAMMHGPRDPDKELLSQTTVARQSLTALETVIDQWEGAFALKASRSGAQEFTARVDEFNAMTQRAEHLLTVLRDAAGVIASAGVHGPRGDSSGAWLEAVRSEVAEGCLASAARCQALDPTAWRSFDAVRDHTVAQIGVEHQAAARRAGTWARKRRDELDARDPATQRRRARAV